MNLERDGFRQEHKNLIVCEKWIIVIWFLSFMNPE